jgi:hypothetical protein
MDVTAGSDSRKKEAKGKRKKTVSNTSANVPVRFALLISEQRWWLKRNKKNAPRCLSNGEVPEETDD